tara:strand:- start:310 stop:1059 length:750 start_codon:yes stop_codon:yes gene_type:complete
MSRELFEHRRKSVYFRQYLGDQGDHRRKNEEPQIVVDMLTEMRRGDISPEKIIAHCAANLIRAYQSEDTIMATEGWLRFDYLTEQAAESLKSKDLAETALNFFLLGQKSEFLRRYNSDIECELANGLERISSYEAAAKALDRKIVEYKRWPPEYHWARAIVQYAAKTIVEDDVDKTLRMSDLAEQTEDKVHSIWKVLNNLSFSEAQGSVWDHIPTKKEAIKEWIKEILTEEESAYIQKRGRAKTKPNIS